MSRRETENLDQAIRQLQSSTISDRQQGLSAIRAAFVRDSAVLRFDPKGDGKHWLALYQALFAAFTNELKKCLKGGVFPTQATGRGSTSVKRLGDIASTVRWLAERSLERLNSRVLKSLLTHLTHGIVHRGKLISAVALDYAKAIKSILTYRPHLQALKDGMWHELLALSFNIVIGYTPKRRLVEDAEDAEDAEDGGMEVDLTADDAEVPSSTESDASHVAGPSMSKLKRSRKDSVPSPRGGPSIGSRSSQPVSLEQIEFMSIVAILLHTPTSPILSGPNVAGRDQQDHQAFPRRLLNYFSLFLRTYTGDTSLHHDYLIALTGALSHLTLNCRQAVSSFARDNWHALVSMWGTKNQRMKEDLVVVLRMLFPLLTAEPLAGEGSIDPTDTFAALWTALDGEAQSRWGAHGLSLESLQLRLLESYHRELTRQAFAAHTFQHGWHFDAEQALSWAILELQADCAEKLYLRSEFTYSSATASGKRLKLENPISSLLLSIRSQSSQQFRAHYLQVLLFFIDRHWHALHDQIRGDIIAVLVPFVSFEDATIQSWTFLCLAAIAHSECVTPPGSSANLPSSNVMNVWDPIWTHAMRRANVPAVSRAACHTAHVLLIHSKRLLSSQRVFAEIESFAKDLDVQGPTYPYDSVCDFMVLCLRMANQDVRLYRMQMEEKVLSWLTESWRIGSERRASMPLHTTTYIHALLEAITGSSKRVRLQCRMMLPHSTIVNAIIEDRETEVIRDFQLHARLPPYRRPGDPSAATSVSPVSTPPDNGIGRASLPFGDSTDLAPPRGRERRLSAFLLKSLEETLLTLGQRDTGYGFPTAERVRSSLDLTVTALCFEASLLMNGTQSNRRVLQAACKLLGAITPLLTDSRWKADERRLILDALDPLMRAEEDDFGKVEWETLVLPGERTGIRTEMLRKLLSSPQSAYSDTALRRDLQRFVFRSVDVQDTFANLLKTLRDVLRLAVGRSLNDASTGKTTIDDSDGFGPIRTTHTTTSIATTRNAQQEDVHNRYIVDACVTALAVVPILQSSSGEPTRDRALTDLVLNSEPDEFLILGPAYCEQVARRTLNLNASNLEALLEKLVEITRPYAHKHSEETLLLVIRVLDSTAHVWLHSPVASSTLGQRARFYCHGTVKRLKATEQRSWRVLDAIIRFLDRYLAIDPKQKFWIMPIEGEPNPDPEDLPAAVLPTFGDDDDIRIRFRVAATSPRLLTVGRLSGRDLMLEVYRDIHGNLSAQQDNYESILTRLLCLGNMVISDASVRRGAYWHLLEIAFYSGTYLPHLKVVLTGIVERMGIATLSDLFNCYASQFAYSIRRAHIDLFKFPPDLLGYRDRRECAEATFHAFTPTNLLAEGSVEEIEYGKELFARHCQAIQKSEQAGIEECFAELVAYEIVFWLNHFSDPKSEENLDARLRQRTEHLTGDVFRGQLEQHADGIVVAILRSLGDQDVSPNGPIMEALQMAGLDDALESFRAITRYRSLDTFETHNPNLPSYPTPVVLRATEWYHARVKQAETPAVTYHVLQQLFADIERSPLVNEQYRLLNAVSLWVACHHDHFQDESLLRTLTRRSVTMLAQVDLARGAQSLLEWCLSLYKASSGTNYHLADILIRISAIAHDFSHACGDPSVTELGLDLLTWAEKQADVLRRNKSFKKQVIRALAAWPRELPLSLQSICEDVKLPDLTSVLIDHGVSASKFRLVRRIHDLASQSDTDDDFSASDFWRLKACIPPENYLVDSDIDAFTSLLMLHHGRIDSVGSDHFEPETIRTIHRDVAVRKSVGSGKNLAPRVDVHTARLGIVASLRSMLDTCSTPQVYVVYKTLRALMSVPSSELYISPTFSGDVRQELEYLRDFSKPFAVAPAPDLHAALMNEEMLRLARDFEPWIARLTTVLCEVLGARDPFFSPLTSVLQSDHSFAEELLPVLVHSLLQHEHDASASGTPESARRVLSDYFASVLSDADTAISCHRALINVVLHLRNFQPSLNPKDALAHDKWLSVDFTLLSRCALKCNAYTTALLFLELAAEYRATEHVSDGSPTENILFEIYSHIDEPDGFYGIQTEDLRNFFAKRVRHENQWDKAFRYHGAVIESGQPGPSDTDGIVKSLYAFGFNQLALNTMQTFFTNTKATAESSALAYNLGWRAETWDLPENLGQDQSGTALYLALRAVYRERNPHAIDAILRRGFIQEMNRLRDLGNENFTEIRYVTQSLMCLNQVRQWRSAEVQRSLQSRRADVSEWKRFATIDPSFDFGNVEAIMATRISLIRSAWQKEQRDQIGDLVSPFCDALLDLEKTCLLCLSERARDVHQSQIALNSIVRAQNLEQSASPKVSQEFANVLWLMKEPKLAIKSLSTLVSSISVDKSSLGPEEKQQNAVLLARLGSWSAEASLKKPSQIVAEYFGPAVELVSDFKPETPTSEYGQAAIFHQYAIFAERQYHIISKSPDALRWKLYVDRRREEIKQRTQEMQQSTSNVTERQQKEANRKAEVLLQQDLQRTREHNALRTFFLTLAVEMYSRCLSASDKFDEDSPIRLCSLWLANFDNEARGLGFVDALGRVPSRKFVFLAHQLTARLSKSDQPPSRNQKILQRVIQQMGCEHPFHTLFPLYCLRIDRSSSQTVGSSRRQSGRHASPASSQMERASAVSDLFDKLRAIPKAGERVKAVEHVCDASLEWAKHPIKHLFGGRKKPPDLKLPENLLIRRIKDIQVPVITAPTPIDHTTEYRDCVWISHYENHYSTAGGVNLPKIIRCIGSDGKAYKQLYKGEGNDDLRQDAVMEQVFDLVNVVLRHDRETQKRRLGVRGYKVIPLASQAGVLEFVENTTPLATWLKPAHIRYHPEDPNGDQIAKVLVPPKSAEWRDDPQTLVNRFVNLREQFRPVMRHYFTEKHKTPTSWFSMRLRYARSVATTSIVGHILGLGDRHTSNILVDDTTGEVVHIDLGIAFEQGKQLPQPERVPFRLTADMVDGLGISGTQGVFQRCAEETLRVLRDGSETILTVLEVFKHDPLHSWTVNEFKIKRAQGGLPPETAQLTGEAFRFAIGIDMDSDATYEAADRALSTVARKLDKTLSVEYTVNELITEASDPANVALMYIGWGPQF